MTYLSKACAALALVQAGAFEAQAQTSPSEKRCQPWPLPPEKYDTWRTLTFNLDSRDY